MAYKYLIEGNGHRVVGRANHWRSACVIAVDESLRTGRRSYVVVYDGDDVLVYSVKASGEYTGDKAVFAGRARGRQMAFASFGDAVGYAVARSADLGGEAMSVGTWDAHLTVHAKVR